MNTLKNTAAVLLTCLLLAACGGEEPLSVRSQTASSASQPVVRLMHAIASTWCPPSGGCYGNNKGYAHGYIEVDNLAFHKQVQRWDFTANIPSGAQHVKFALSYAVGGDTFWDNNFKRDYVMTVPGKIHQP